MERILLGIVLTLTIFGCKKEEVPISNLKKDYSSFLSEKGLSFRGKLNANSFYWSFGYQFQSNNMYDTASKRMVMFGLVSEDGGDKWFQLYSPKYNSESASDFLKVFGLGEKKLGDWENDFYLRIYTNADLYESNSLNTASEIEILKTQEFTNGSGKKKLRVWFRIDANLFSSNKSVTLKEGLMIAEFYGFKK
jgi:hypothetical protein